MAHFIRPLSECVVVSSISIVTIARDLLLSSIYAFGAFLCAFICFSVRFATFNLLLSRSALSEHRRTNMRLEDV